MSAAAGGRRVVLGTAGHIDHGKSTLVQALTGEDPDRLAEEKRRGITIELGFAQLELPDGSALGVVDVPGHTKGSVVFFYKDYIFTGDAVGSGHLFMMEATTDTYLPSLEHFMAEVLLRNEDVDYELLTGHWENLNPFSVEYLRHMLILVKGVIRGDIPIGYYTRKPGRWAGYLDANIFYPYAVLSYENEK